MNNKFDLSFSEDALLNRVLFISGKNKINLFVEDTNKEFEYEEIFEKIFSEDFKLNCIFPTNGKPYLIEAYNLFGTNEEYGKNIFIADGDFDILLGKSMVNSDNFIYLEKYNIETYLINKKAIINTMRPRLKLEKSKVEKYINLDYWYSKILPFMKKIFSLHCLVQLENISLKNVGRNPNSFLNKNGLPNYSQCEKYELEIKSYIPDIEEKYNQLNLTMEQSSSDDPLKFICGKYLLTSLCLYLNDKSQYKYKYDKLKADLISRIDPECSIYIKNRVTSYLT
jgi:hypothetical protein